MLLGVLSQDWQVLHCLADSLYLKTLKYLVRWLLPPPPPPPFHTLSLISLHVNWTWKFYKVQNSARRFELGCHNWPKSSPILFTHMFNKFKCLISHMRRNLLSYRLDWLMLLIYFAHVSFNFLSKLSPSQEENKYEYWNRSTWSLLLITFS